MRQTYPIFDERGEKGGHKQQDADECFQAMLQSWRTPLQRSNDNEDVVGNLFEIELESEAKCLEAPEEPASVQTEKVLRLSCHIDNENNPINSMSEGLRLSLGGQMEKNSPSLGRNAIYQKTSRVNKLVSLAPLFSSLSLLTQCCSCHVAFVPVRAICALLLEERVCDEWH